MNMISTGAFQTEMDASNKQNTIAKKFASAWEKKNAKAARAGGVSLMALSLAACGSDDSTTTTASTSTTTATTTTTTTTPVVDAAKNLVFTVSGTTGYADALVGGSGDDTFNGMLASSFEAGDTADGGAGTDTITINLGAVTAAASLDGTEVKNIENVRIDFAHDGGAADAISIAMGGFAGVTKASVYHASNSGSTADAVLTFAGSNMTTGVDLEIIGGDSGANNSSIDITATYQSVTGAADSSNLLLNGAAANVVTIAGIETVSVTATSTDTSVSAKGYSAINTLTTANAATININADSKLTIGAMDAAAAVTIDASASTGILVVTGETAATSSTFTAGSGATTYTQASTGTVSFTGGAAADTLDVSGGNGSVTAVMGAGNDLVKVGAASNLTAADSIKGGDGEDTLTVSDATLNATTKAAIVEATEFEILGTAAAAEVAVDFNALSVFDKANVTVAGTATAATTVVGSAVDGTDAVGVTMDNSDELTITDARVGQAGAIPATGVATGKDGGDGLGITPVADGAANIATIRLVGNADLTGGAGSKSSKTDADQTTGSGGMGINASNIETLNMIIVGNEASADTVTIGGGAAGVTNQTNGATDSGDTAGSAGVDITVGTNATITLTDELSAAGKAYSAVDLGTVKGTNVTVDGSALDGALTVTTADGNTVIKGGAKGDTLAGGAGADTITGGAGNDDIEGNAGIDTMTGGAGADTFSIVENNSGTAVVAVTDIITDFEIGLSKDKIDLEMDGAVIGDKASTDVSAAVTGTTDLKATTAKGIITLSGTGVSLVDTAAELVDIFELMDGTGTEEFGAIVANGNTTVFGINSSNAVLEVVQLTGLTDATAISLTGADGTILIA
jgi:Ca2+-binding RTX toxin-like protein